MDKKKVDMELEDIYLSEREIKNEEIRRAIRRVTIERKFVPVFIGSAFKNKGVQPLLDGVKEYIPSPPEIDNYAIQNSISIQNNVIFIQKIIKIDQN